VLPAYNRFSHLRERFHTPAAVVNFSPFWAGNFRRRAKTTRAVVHRRHEASPTEQKKMQKRGHPREKYE
jgi:hypothetical protein